MRVKYKAVSFLLVIVLLLTPLCVQAQPADEQLTAVLSASQGDQAAAFVDYVSTRMSHATVRSLAGRSGDWLAFISLCQTFENGEPADIAMQDGSIQYGMRCLPSNVKSASFIVEDEVAATADITSGILRFDRFEPLVASASDGESEVLVLLTDENRSIILYDEFTAEAGIPTYTQALEAMCPAFVAFAAKNSVDSVVSASMRLKGYLPDIIARNRLFTWELYLYHGEVFPCQATIIRYECDTNRTSVVRREVSQLQ